jgi:hypothetical protein
MATSNCLFTTYCVQNTGFPEWDDNYIRTGTFNDNSYYIGQTNGYVIFFSSEGYWCLSDYIDGTCFLSGKKPCYTICPDLCEDYFTRGVCPPPVPDPAQECATFDFEAYFDCDVDITPTLTPTNTSTPTPTPTPTSTSLCPLYVNASIQSYTPTPTTTPSLTPSSTGLITRGCGFLGDVTFNTINTTIICSFSLEFQDCYNGFKYYTTNQLSNPSGGQLEQFMIFQANVDGKRACISYVGVNNDIIGGNNIIFISNLFGYSNLGQCASCLSVLSPTPTPTPSITPTITLTASSNKPAVSSTPTPTKSKPVLYYTYEKCGTTQRVCQPFEAYVGQLINTIFETGNSGQYPKTCWSLVSITSSCSANNPNYTTITYSTNAFPSVLNNIYTNCSGCLGTTVDIPPCNPHVVYLSTDRCSLCEGQFNTSILTIYSPSVTLTNSSVVYYQANCTNLIPSNYFLRDVTNGNVFDIGTNGVLTLDSCVNCPPPPPPVDCRCAALRNQGIFPRDLTYIDCNRETVTVEVAGGSLKCICYDRNSQIFFNGFAQQFCDGGGGLVFNGCCDQVNCC